MKYTAITIGPIFRTLEKARSTKAIWSSSYLFSYLMKQIYKEIRKEIKKDEILLPYVSEEMLKDDFNKKAGLFPDRIIFEGELNNFEKLKNTVISNLADIISKDINKDKDKIERYLQKYLIIKSISKEIVGAEKNVVKIMDNFLNVQELQQQTFTQDDEQDKEDYIKQFLEFYNKNGGKKKKYNSFINEEFGGQPFKSINQIATALLNHTVKDNEDDNQENFYEKIKETCKDDYKPMHKYIAIVQADGDNIGALIQKLSETPNNFKEDIQKFSERLSKFSIQALDIIEKEKGTPIFAGGDDLLFFAPVAKVENQKVTSTILNVCKEISESFDKLITKKYKNLNLEKKPSMSYGISISYYKFPLDQSLSLAYEGLQKTKDGDKNAIRLNVTKHSGQQFSTIFKQDATTFTQILDFFSKNGDSDFFANFMYKLDSLKTAILGIGEIEEKEERNTRFKAFLDNYFDEEIHTGSSFLNIVQNLLQTIYTENPLLNCNEEEKKKRNKQNIEKLYSTLRYYHFIYTKKEEQ